MKVFDGKLGTYFGEKIHLELQHNAHPVHSQAYSAPHIHKAAFKNKLEHLVQIDMLQKCGPTKWASLTFIISKKDG